MKIQILDKTKKKRFVEALSGFGLKKIPEMLIRSGNEKIRAFSGDLTSEDIMKIWRLLPIEGIGLYVGKEIVNRKSGERETRLTLDGCHVWKSAISTVAGDRGPVAERIIELNEEQEKDWFLGRDVDLNEGQVLDEIGGLVLVKSGEDFVGVGKIGIRDKVLGVRTLFGFLPKERRRKERMG